MTEISEMASWQHLLDLLCFSISKAKEYCELCRESYRGLFLFLENPEVHVVGSKPVIVMHFFTLPTRLQVSLLRLLILEFDFLPHDSISRFVHACFTDEVGMKSSAFGANWLVAQVCASCFPFGSFGPDISQLLDQMSCLVQLNSSSKSEPKTSSRKRKHADSPIDTADASQNL